MNLVGKPGDTKKSIEQMVKEIYDAERNIMINSFWDSGHYFAIGDETNGFSDHVSFYDFREGVEWLYSEIVGKNA